MFLHCILSGVCLVQSCACLPPKATLTPSLPLLSSSCSLLRRISLLFSQVHTWEFFCLLTHEHARDTHWQQRNVSITYCLIFSDTAVFHQGRKAHKNPASVGIFLDITLGTLIQNQSVRTRLVFVPDMPIFQVLHHSRFNKTKQKSNRTTEISCSKYVIFIVLCMGMGMGTWCWTVNSHQTSC